MSLQTAISAEHLADVIERHRFSFRNEKELQGAVSDVLTNDGFTIEREVRLNDSDRIDILVGRVGVEIKTSGPSIRVARQLQRYAASDLLDELVLVTHQSRHVGFMPKEIGNKPLRVVWIGGSL